MDYNAWNILQYFVFGLLQRLGVHCVSCVSYLPLCVRALGQICVACVNKNKFENVLIFASTLRSSLHQLLCIDYFLEFYDTVVGYFLTIPPEYHPPASTITDGFCISGWILLNPVKTGCILSKSKNGRFLYGLIAVFSRRSTTIELVYSIPDNQV